MQMNRMVFHAAALALVLGSAPAAFADRAATPEEAAMIADALAAQGFSSFKEIEWDDGRWEVDDAVGPDGRVYDLKLDQTLTVVGREIED
jgi:hypothetical protein